MNCPNTTKIISNRFLLGNFWMPGTELDIATAYHEAGHAVVALVHDRPVHRVSVLPNQIGRAHV